MKFLLLIMTLVTQLAWGQAFTISGNAVKAIRPNLNLDDVAYILTGFDDPTVVAVRAPKGSLYMRLGDDGGQLYVKTDTSIIPTTSWSLIGAGSIGTVTSVGLSLPSMFNVTGSPVLTTGTLAATLATQSANTFLAGPTSGGAATPSFRTIVAADIPTLNQNTTGTAANVSGVVALVNGGTGVAAASANAAFAALSPLTTKGDLATYSTVNTRLPVGSNGQVLSSDSAETTGLKWVTPTTGANTNLSNLSSPTALNEDLLPGTPNVRFIGSTTDFFAEMDSVNFSPIDVGGVKAGELKAVAGTTVGLSTDVGLSLGTFSTATYKDLAVTTASNSDADAAATGGIVIKTGDKSAGTGNSGNIYSITGTSSGGTRGKIYLRDGSEGTAGHVWTSTGTAGQGGWAAASGGANTTLSNLTSPTTVNQDLLPLSSGGQALGSTAKKWGGLKVNNYLESFGANGLKLYDSDNSDLITVQTPTVVTSHTLTLPGTQGGASTVLTNNGSGVLSWSSPSAGNLANDTFLKGRNAANSADVNIVKVNTSDNVQLGDVGNFTNAILIGDGSNYNGTGITIDSGQIYGVAGANASGYFEWDGTATYLLGDGINPHVMIFDNTAGGFGMGIRAYPTLAANYTLTLPPNDGSSGEFLQTDGSGNLTWAATSGANTALSNLASTAVNASIIPGTDLAINFGSASKRIAQVWTSAVFDVSAVTGEAGSNADFEIYGDGQMFIGSTQTDMVQLFPYGGNAPELQFADNDGSNYVGFKAPGTLAGNTTYILPAVDGGAGDTLSTDGAGNLSWAPPAGGQWVKYTKTFTDFSTAALTNSLVLFSLPAGSTADVIIHHTAAFTGGGASSVVLNVETADFLLTGAVVLSAPTDVADVAVDLDGTYSSINFATARDVLATLVADVNLDQLTTGSVDIYIKYATLP